MNKTKHLKEAKSLPKGHKEVKKFMDILEETGSIEYSDHPFGREVFMDTIAIAFKRYETKDL